MSQSTTFALTVPLPQLPAFCAALTPLVASWGCGTGAVLEQPAGPITAASLLTLLQALLDHPHRDKCLSLRFAEDGLLLDFQREQEQQHLHPAGFVNVGCFWTRCRRVEGGVEVSFDSATGSISRLMQLSQTVRDTFRSLAPFSGDGRIQVIDEWQDVSHL